MEKNSANKNRIKEDQIEILDDYKNNSVEIEQGALRLSDKGNIIIGTLNVFSGPIKKRHEKHYKESNFHLWADLLIVLSILALLIFILWVKLFLQSANASLEIKAQSEAIVSGETEFFEIYYKNDGNRVMEDVNISFLFPENFNLKKIVPSDGFDFSTNNYKLQDLETGANGSLKVEGVIFDEIGSRHNISTYLNYFDQGISKKTISTYVFGIDSSVLELLIESSEDIYKNSQYYKKISIENTSDMDIDNLRLVLQVEKSKLVSITSEDSAVSREDNYVMIDWIEAGKKIDVDFLLIAQEEGEEHLDFRLFKKINTESYLQSELISSFEIKEPKLELSAYNQDSCIEKGEAQTYKITITNNEDVDIDDLGLSLLSSNKNYRVSKVSGNNINLKNNTINIDKLASGELKIFDVLVDFETIEARDKQELGLVLDLDYQIDSKRASVKSFSNKQKVLGEIEISSRLLYFSAEGDQLGVGPLPPKVSVPTSYWVYWDLDALGTELEFLNFVADLSPAAIYSDRKSLLAGDFNYDINSKTITWSLGDIKKDAKLSKLRFGLSILPTEEMIATIPNLLNSQTVKYKDRHCGLEFEKNLGTMDISLEADTRVSETQKIVK